MMNGYGGWGVGAWLMMSLVTLVVLALIVAGVVAVNRRSRSASTPPAPGSGGSDALRTLDDRFARGEIDEAEYAKRRDLLKPS
ncbi:MAG TPA: SHOCT domain-containing protein [Nakamurella sp.]